MTTPTPVADEKFARPATDEAIDRAAGALRGRGITVDVVDTVPGARQRVNELLPPGKAVFTAASETLRLSGITEDVDESGRFVSLREQLPPGDIEQFRLRGTTPDVIVGSVHAVTEGGELLAASASGSQLAPYAAGAAQVLWVIGAQKVVPDLDTALRRIRTYSFPKEHARCLEAYGQPSVLSKILIIEREIFPGRATAVLVREPIGF
ncbi:LUD domain-containing protein [Amycolatopsis cihanbeyliensis]|uniref:YkgG family uncharacterized protein n=1 Tax=Amycolatopsis cihanbeyliensis TaxID=1128664 RepID=A0A542DI87_AMYCI|nr:LUD domain-containing protein [Amycolatopsis cihanbeyliensis]TQJ02770.1 YkgG family uncharacterized protein [Amycolatopsis cihanbeyliensis]